MKLKQRVYEALLNCNGAISAVELSKKVNSNTAAIGVSIGKLSEDKLVSITKVKFGSSYKYEMFTSAPYAQLFKPSITERVESVLLGRRSYLDVGQILAELKDKSITRKQITTVFGQIKVKHDRSLLNNGNGGYRMIVTSKKIPLVEVDRSISTAKMNSIFRTVMA